MLDDFESRHAAENLQEKNFGKYENESSVVRDCSYSLKNTENPTFQQSIGMI